MLEIQDFQPGLRDRWDEFVLAHPQGSPFHLIAWQHVLVQAFGYKPKYYAALDNGIIQGLLPLFLVDGFITGKALISTPFAVYGGVLALTEVARRKLADHAAELGKEAGVQYVEFRNGYPEQVVGWAPIQRYATFTKAVQLQSEEALLAAIPKKTRNMIRKSMKAPFEVRRVRDWRRFERLHSATLRRLGTPSFPPKLFDSLMAEFGDMIDICEVWHQDAVVGASLCFLFREQMHIYYAATDSQYNSLAPNYRMYFDQLLRAGEKGFRIFDFGRSKFHTGTFEFKRHWDTEMRELPYEVLLVRRRELPNFSPVNPKFDLAIRIWQKLPLALTRLVGPRLVRLFP